MLKIRNRWHAAAALVAALSWLAHEGLGLIGIAGRIAQAPEGADGALAFAFSLWNAGGSLLVILAVGFLAAALHGRAVILASAATLMALGCAILPAAFVAFHHQPLLGAFQTGAFGLMALFGFLGLARPREGGSILRR